MKEDKIVFIVDDNETNRVTAKNALEGIYKTYAMPSAGKMFEMLEKIKPDLILLDIEMPGMDGYDALMLLKLEDAHKDIPVILLTAKNTKDSVLQGVDSGAASYIIKPFEPSLLVERIAQYV
ncbi:MAG: response regulator [Defluviitaleaceae bacterium]|nr:response regulator [Defluviitaleaceae bacterium]MCL2273919.1 response regulator [Defluviitaleaceae bacterium]